MAKKEPAPIKFPPSAVLGSLFAKVVAIAERFPGAQVSRSYGTPSIKVKQKFMARLRSEAEGGLAIRCDFIEREMLLQALKEASNKRGLAAKRLGISRSTFYRKLKEHHLI